MAETDRRAILANMGFRGSHDCWRADFGLPLHAAIADDSVDTLDELMWEAAVDAWRRKEGLRIGAIPDYPEV
jgi:hypothetical protein